MLISYGKQSLDQADIDSVVEILKGDWLTQGPAIENFEHDLNQYFGSKFSCAVSNGTAALHLTGLCLGWEKNDIIITSPLTFLATANSIIYCGATPSFVDIDPQNYTIDPNHVEEKIKFNHEKGQKVKAIIGIDYAGNPCDWKSLRSIANSYDVKLVNDNCHALGASYEGSKKYGMKYADVITQSYHPVKHITTGEGGAILSNDKEFIDLARVLRSHGMTKDPELMLNNDGPWYYEMIKLGYNYRLTDFQSALGSSQLKRLDRFINKRRSIAKKYDASFIEIKEFITPKVRSISNHGFHLYPLQINFDVLEINKIAFFKKMYDNSINLQVHYIPIHLQPFYKKLFGSKKGDLPISEKFYENEVSLPIYPDLLDKDVDNVISKVLDFTSK